MTEEETMSIYRAYSVPCHNTARNDLNILKTEIGNREILID
ncbi:MAG: hypothetical protein ACXWFZ_05840 [Nitrososphaeraceae archaeon]